MKKKPKKLAIVACGKSHKEAPYNDECYEIWSLNEHEIPRYDVMFELHPMEVQNEKELDFLYHCEKPVYVLEETPLVPKGIVYPLEDILENLWAIDYFTCTMAYQIALAIHLGFKYIELWGMNMDVGSSRERTIESACIQCWFGIAKGLGIDIRWKEHPMFYRYNYGYDYHKEMLNVHTLLGRLLATIIYNLGPTASMGGNNLPIRREKID